MPIDYPAGVVTTVQKRQYRDKLRADKERLKARDQPRRRRSRTRSPERKKKGKKASRKASPVPEIQKASPGPEIQNGNLRRLQKQRRKELNVGKKRIAGGVENLAEKQTPVTKGVGGGTPRSAQVSRLQQCANRRE